MIDSRESKLVQRVGTSQELIGEYAGSVLRAFEVLRGEAEDKGEQLSPAVIAAFQTLVDVAEPVIVESSDLAAVARLLGQETSPRT